MTPTTLGSPLVLLVISWSWSVAIESLADTLFEFSGRSDQREQFGFDESEAFGAPSGFGSFVYRQVGDDTDPDPRVGVYTVFIETFEIAFAGDTLAFQDISAEATVRDNYGCDCFFVDIPFKGMLAGQPFNRLIISIQDEFGPEAFTMFDDDSLPLSGLHIPPESWTTLMLYLDSDLTIFNIDQNTVKVSELAIPEPASMLLAQLCMLTALRRVRRRRD